MTHSQRHSCSGQYATMIQSLMLWSMLVAVGLSGQLHAKQSTHDSSSSVISQQLLDQVDQLLAVEHLEASNDMIQGMGPLVQIAEQGKVDVGIVAIGRQSQNDLKVTAIPLPDAFAMSLFLLTILIIAYVIRRVRLAV